MIVKRNKDIPEKPGVYLFKSQKKILYIGKAGNLNRRVNQYFSSKNDIIINNLLTQADDIEFIVTDDEKDALHLEYNLIHTYRPPFNIKLKDDKSFPYIEISTRHPFPGIYFSRNVDEKNFHVGPITNSKKTRDLIDIVTRIFKLRTCSDAVFNRSTPCLYFFIDRCSAPCRRSATAPDDVIKRFSSQEKLQPETKLSTNNSLEGSATAPDDFTKRFSSQEKPQKATRFPANSSTEYAKSAAGAVAFLKGQKENVLEQLANKMNRLAGELKFEEAQKTKEDIEFIKQFTVESYISSVRKTDYDVIDVYKDDQNDCFFILFSIVAGRVKRREFFNFDTIHSKEEDTLKDFLISFYKRENIPQEILVPFIPTDRENIETLFSRIVKRKIKIKIPQRGDKKKMCNLARKNLNLYINRNKYETVGRRIKARLKLSRFPVRIEGYDISHLSERDRVGAVVTFSKGKAVRKNYRNYIIKKAESGDIAALKEVIERRFGKKTGHPDLLLIDGGKAQLNAALEVKAKLQIDSDVVSIAKREERIYLENGGSVIFHRGSAERFLFQNIRDEAHRRAITHHKKRREKI